MTVERHLTGACPAQIPEGPPSPSVTSLPCFKPPVMPASSGPLHWLFSQAGMPFLRPSPRPLLPLLLGEAHLPGGTLPPVHPPVLWLL